VARGRALPRWSALALGSLFLLFFVTLDLISWFSIWQFYSGR
jgi:hypothetical protein